MTQAAAEVRNGSAAANAGLRRYAEARGSARALRRTLGQDVDPDYCLTDFLFRVATGDGKGLAKHYGAEVTKAPLGQASGPTGGYLVPRPIGLNLMDAVAEEALIRPRANVVPMTSSLMQLPLPDAATAQSAGTSAFYGGMKLLWTAEGTSRTETEPTWRQVELRAWDLTGYCVQSNPHYQDSGSGVEGYLRKLFAGAIAWYEDFAYFNGSGAGMPLGVINSAAAKTVSRQTGSQFTQQDLYNMSKALLPASWSRSVWFANPAHWEWFTKLTQWQANIVMDDIPGNPMPHFLLQGRPGYFTEKLPGLNSPGDVVLMDPSLYVLGDRNALEIAVSFDEPTAFLKNQAVWRVTYRGDGQPQFSKTLTLADGTTTVSPYVVLV